MVNKNDIEEEDGSRLTTNLLFVAGVLLLAAGCSQSFFMQLISALDVRTWPWWGFCMFLVLLFFSLRWSWLYMRWEDYDELDREAARRFLNLSIYTVALAFVFLAIRYAGLIGVFRYSLEDFFEHGIVSFGVIAMIFVIVASAGLLLYFFKEWLVTFWKV